eukprot:symbB.v1.2.019019.t2/scaffold1541.1/size112753/1
MKGGKGKPKMHRNGCKGALDRCYKTLRVVSKDQQSVSYKGGKGKGKNASQWERFCIAQVLQDSTRGFKGGKGKSKDASQLEPDDMSEEDQQSVSYKGGKGKGKNASQWERFCIAQVLQDSTRGFKGGKGKSKDASQLEPDDMSEEDQQSVAASTFSYRGGKAKGKDASQREPDAMEEAFPAGPVPMGSSGYKDPQELQTKAKMPSPPESLDLQSGPSIFNMKGGKGKSKDASQWEPDDNLQDLQSGPSIFNMKGGKGKSKDASQWEPDDDLQDLQSGPSIFNMKGGKGKSKDASQWEPENLQAKPTTSEPNAIAKAAIAALHRFGWKAPAPDSKDQRPPEPEIGPAQARVGGWTPTAYKALFGDEEDASDNDDATETPKDKSWKDWNDWNDWTDWKDEKEQTWKEKSWEDKSDWKQEWQDQDTWNSKEWESNWEHKEHKAWDQSDQWKWDDGSKWKEVEQDQDKQDWDWPSDKKQNEEKGYWGWKKDEKWQDWEDEDEDWNPDEWEDQDNTWMEGEEESQSKIPLAFMGPKAKAMPTKPKALPKKRPLAPSKAPPEALAVLPRIFDCRLPDKMMVATPKNAPKPPKEPPPRHLKEEAERLALAETWEDEEEDFVEEDETDQWNGWQDWSWEEEGAWDQDWKRMKATSSSRWQDSGDWEGKTLKRGRSPKVVKPKAKPKRPKFFDAPDRWNGKDWEQSRQETGLKLLGQTGPPTSRWEYRIVDESRRSFLGFMPSAFSPKQCETLLEQIQEVTTWQVPPDSGSAPRQVAWMTRKGCSCKYRYGGLELESQDFPPFMIELLSKVMKHCGLTNPKDWPDSCSLNYYEDGAASLGWHADDEALFQGKLEDISIVSLSLGQARRFELRRTWPEVGETELEKLTLSNGDLMTMEGMMQKHFQHRIPKGGCVEPRINLTWRWIRKHYPECPASRRR